MQAIAAEDLSFSYGSASVLQTVSFAIFEGDFVGIVGQNGAGKSTLLKLLLGQLTPSAGRVSIWGEDIRRYRQWWKIGYVAQVGAAAAGFPATAEEVVQANLCAQIGLMRFPQQRHRDQVKHALELVGMQEQAKRLIGSLSGGQLQRVMIARALVGQPQIMLLDEPTSGIDARSAEALYELLARLNGQIGLTIVMVTHDLGGVAEYARRVFYLEEGSLLEVAPDQLADRLFFRRRRSGKAR